MLSGLAQVRVTESAGRVTLDSGGVSTPLSRNRVVPLGSYRLLAAGAAGRTVLMVFGVPREVRAPAYFPFAPAAIDTVTLRPPQQRQSVLLLAPEGNDVEADEAGSVTVSRFGPPVSLRVRRFPATIRRRVGTGDLLPRCHQRAGVLSRRALRQPAAARQRTLPARLQPGAEPLLRVQLSVPVPGAVAGKYDHGAGGGR